MSKFRRLSGKSLNFEETENVPPLNPNQETPRKLNNKPDQELGFKSSKLYRTPTKPKLRNQECGVAMRTPEKQGVLAKNRYGWGQDSRDEARTGNGNVNLHPPPPPPRLCRTPGRPSLGFSEANSARTTPAKSASKPPNPGLLYGGGSSCRHPVNGGSRTSNFTALTKGIPVIRSNYTTINTVEVPQFQLREDPSFWMDHNVQVLIRIRPLNEMEIRTEGYNRCLKQESAQSLTWVGNSEARFTFDHVACETIDQETLFKMVGLPMVENCLSGYNSCMFAYGQTGSGKTHTMLGEINDFEVKPSPNRGMTPRIFEFLFARIIAEMESRKDERLEYSCKCSFLEIYNEQITDLLDPSSTNLQLREDVKKGVYVENLTEYEVQTVGDILKLLSQGSANRRVAATNMNRESSRSHSVFTCVIESRWEKDSMSNLRYARLNLVDLAGSESQKKSGAEGERLKEASNINKSLSTLGLVIMALVDGATGRTRHVPYRDSRLTFLLQDSLGGNSKTMIIANVSPSISSATETLNTLKFAQRAKLIQNNAVINEDASGDVMALQHQIRLLKEELANLKRHNISRSLTFSSKDENCSSASSIGDDDTILRVSCKHLKSLESSLNGALRREKSTESCIKQLEEEIEQLKCLVSQREDENRCTKMILKFREDKIQTMESVVAGLVPVDSYLQDENNLLIEENEILRAKVDRNPEVTRFAVENIRLREQLKRFQDFYEEGEREMLLSEVSQLRDQLVQSQQDNCINHSMEKEAVEDQKEIAFLKSELKRSQEELDKCRDNLNSFVEKNVKLCREVSDLNALLEMQKSDQDDGIEEPILDLQLEIEILKIVLKENRSILGETEEKLLFTTKHNENLRDELQEAKSVIEALEIQQLTLINELEDLKNRNKQYDEISNQNELKMTPLKNQIIMEVSRNHLEKEDSLLQEKLEKMHDALDNAKKLNVRYQTDRACHASNEEEMDEVRKQVEAETTYVIISLQEELVSFQREMNERILKENETRHELTLLQECNKELRERCAESDLLTNEIEEVLNVGRKALDDASSLLGCSKRRWVTEQLQVIARNISEKELRIEELNSCLEAAKNRCNEMESSLRALRGATLVMSEAHQHDCNKKDHEVDQLLTQLSLKDSIVSRLEEQIKKYEVELTEARLYAAQQAVASICYLEKITEADSMINKLVSENEGMKIDITEKQIETYTIGEVVCLEEKIVSVSFAKELEFLILFSKLEQVSSENNDLEKEKIITSAVLLKLKEEVMVSYVDMQLKDWILAEKDAEIAILQREIEMNQDTFLDSSCKLQDELKIKDTELRQMMLYEDETQRSVKEADLMVNKLVIENEALKIEIEDLKRKEVTFINENHLLNENYSLLETQFKTEVEELEHMIRDIQNTVDDDLMLMTSDVFEIKSRFSESNKLMHSWCEDIWSEIIAKDWAMSVLHVCQMRILTETVAGLNAEKSLLNHGLCQSNYLISQLKEQNGNSLRELEACTLLRGKLLGDIKNNFDRISRKEEEVGKLSIEMTRFEKKILELEVLEGEMLERSSRMGHELSMLMNELVNENDEALRCLEEKLVTDLSAKEIEVSIMYSKLQQLASENNDLRKACGTSKEYGVEKEEEVKVYKKSVQELECVVNVLKNQVEMVKGDAERQGLQREELELELQRIRQQEKLLTTENELVKTENANNKMKLTELQDVVKNLSGEQILQQRIQHLAKLKVYSERPQTSKDDSFVPSQAACQESRNTIKASSSSSATDFIPPPPELLPIALRKGTRACTRSRSEENNVLKTQNDEISNKLRRAEAIITRVNKELSSLRAANRRTSL